ncbi:hypothetical protein BVI1335_1270060 [Burkholderia vietnamiensis]|nr:hypothetical protein BVI1335_1270060 [Burkholderia vietnamiensis]
MIFHTFGMLVPGRGVRGALRLDGYGRPIWLIRFLKAPNESKAGDGYSDVSLVAEEPSGLSHGLRDSRCDSQSCMSATRTNAKDEGCSKQRASTGTSRYF